MQLSDIDILNPDTYSNGLPHEQFAYLRENAPCFRQTINDPGMIDGAWVITRYDDVRRITRDAADYLNSKGVSLRATSPTIKSDGGKPAMISIDGPEHDRLRQLVNRGFTRKAIYAFEETWRTLTNEILDKALQNESFDFVTEVAVELPMQVICSLMGVPDEDRHKLLKWSNTISTPLDPELAPSPESVVEALTSIWAYGVELAELRRRKPGNDIMTKLNGAADGDALTDDELMGFTLLLIGAGNETTRMALAHGLLALLQQPDQMAWLREHADPMPESAVEEILRFTTPVVLLRRTAAQDAELHGCQIKEGDALTLMYGSANFDPDQFPDPLKLDLQRTPNEHLTFGYGKHFCLGAFVARLEIKVLFEEFLRRTRDVKLAGDVVYGRDCLFRPFKHLPITVTLA